MNRFVPLVFLASLGACVATNGSVQTVDGYALSVAEDDDYFWPETMTGQMADGSIYPIDVFPIVTALVVRPARGGRMEEGDKALARAAVDAHCAERGLGPTSFNARFAEDAWAFYPCTSN